MTTTNLKGSSDVTTVGIDEVTIALEPQQVELIAEELIGDMRSRFEDDVEVATASDIARVRAMLDNYQRWLDELQWGKVAHGLSVTLPKSLLEGIARDMYERAGDRLTYSAQTEPLDAVRHTLAPALLATAIVDQLEATR